MKKPKYCLTVLPTLPAVATAAALLSLATSPVAAQQILNGEHTFVFQQPDWRPSYIFMGFGEGQDATVTLQSTWITSGGATLPAGSIGARWADSDGTGTHNTVVLNIDSDSMLQTALDHDGLADVFGFDGTLEVNVDGSVPSTFLPPGNLRTRRVSMAVMPGSSATVNLTGPHAIWDSWQRHIDVGIGGTAAINITEGGRIIEAQRLAVGGTRWTATAGLITDPDTGEVTREPYAPEAGGEGTVIVDGPDSLIQFSSNVNGWLRVGRRSTGTLIVRNGALVDASTNTGSIESGLEVWVGDLGGGDGNLIIESGGVLNATGLFRINSQNSDRGYVRIDGSGSELNMIGTGGATSFIGNAAANPGAIGIMEVVNGGRAIFRSPTASARNLRIGNQEAAIGEVTVDGDGSVLEIGNFLQIGFAGTGTFNLTGGGRLLVGDEGTSFSSIGREDTGHGTFVIDGAGSLATFDNSLYIATGSNAIDSPGTGTAVVEVRNEGVLEVGSFLAARSAGSIVLDGGTIRMTGTAPISIAGPNASLTGQGVLEGNLVVGNSGTLQGAGAGILLTGTLSGTGAVENFTLGGVQSVAATGSLALNNVRFAQNAPINVTINNLDNAPGLIAFDGDTDFAGAHLMIVFDPFAPSETWSGQLFNYTGAGSANYNFASVTVPEGWVLDNGLLRHSSQTGPGDSAFDDWAAGYGLSGADAAPGANPAGDGHLNVAKFAFGVSPVVAVPALVDVSREGDMLVLRWNRSTDAGITYVIEETATLSGWTAVPGATPVVMAEPDVAPPAGYERVEWSVDVSAAGSRSFYRVSATVAASLLP